MSSIPEEILEKLRGENARERMLHRLHAIALVQGGLSAKEVARLYGDSPRAVAYWVTRFHANGFESLAEGKRSGRPSRLNASQMKKLRSFVVAQRSKNQSVNAAMLSAHIKTAFNVRLNARQCWRILKEIV